MPFSKLYGYHRERFSPSTLSFRLAPLGVALIDKNGLNKKQELGQILVNKQINKCKMEEKTSRKAIKMATNVL